MSDTLKGRFLVSSCILSTVLLMLFQQACVLHPKRTASKPAHADTSAGCGPELSKDKVYEIATEAILKMGNDPSSLRTHYEVTIEPNDCEYIFTAIPKGLEAVDGISMRIDRSGTVKSFPWCCPLEHCPELCNWRVPDS